MPVTLWDKYAHFKNMKTLSSVLNSLLKEIKNYASVNEHRRISPFPQQTTIGDIFSKHKLARTSLKPKQ